MITIEEAAIITTIATPQLRNIVRRCLAPNAAVSLEDVLSDAQTSTLLWAADQLKQSGRQLTAGHIRARFFKTGKWYSKNAARRSRRVQRRLEVLRDRHGRQAAHSHVHGNSCSTAAVAFECCPSQVKRILERSVIEQISTKDLATELGVSVSTAYNLVLNAKSTLKMLYACTES